MHTAVSRSLRQHHQCNKIQFKITLKTRNKKEGDRTDERRAAP